MARFCSIERSPSRSPDETLPTRLPRANLLLRCPSWCHSLSLSIRHTRTALNCTTVPPLAPCRIRRIAADRRASRCRPPARCSTHSSSTWPWHAELSHERTTWPKAGDSGELLQSDAALYSCHPISSTPSSPKARACSCRPITQPSCLPCQSRAGRRGACPPRPFTAAAQPPCRARRAVASAPPLRLATPTNRRLGTVAAINGSG